MLTTLLGLSKKLIYQEVNAAHYPATILIAPQRKPSHKKLDPRHAAELTFRIQMCISSGQAYEFHNRQNDLSPIQPLMRSIIRDLNRLRDIAPEEELRFSYMLNPMHTASAPAATPHFARLAQQAKSHSSLYNETIAVK